MIKVQQTHWSPVRPGGRSDAQGQGQLFCKGALFNMTRLVNNFNGDRSDNMYIIPKTKQNRPIRHPLEPHVLILQMLLQRQNITGGGGGGGVDCCLSFQLIFFTFTQQEKKKCFALVSSGYKTLRQN